MQSVKGVFRDLDKPLLFISVGLFIFGLFNIVTASSNEAVERYGVSIYYYFGKQLFILIIGLIASLIIFRISTKYYKKIFTMLFLIINVILVYLLIYGSFSRGAKNWINIFGIVFQPSEFAKPIIIVCVALIFDKFYKMLRNINLKHYNIIGLILFVGLLPPAIIFLQKDLGTMFIMVCVFFIMFLASPILKTEKVKTMGLISILVLAAVLIMKTVTGHVLTPAQMARFNFFNPCSTYETGGYQVCNGIIAINTGGLFGSGIGNSKQKYSYIPEPHTDMVFSIIAEEQGFIKGTLILLLMFYVVYRILKISANASTIRGKYICLGVASYIFMHMFVNLGGLFAVIPLTGVPLPFLSYGGSFTLTLILSLAMVQRVNIETRRKKIKV
ncbi:MAG: FtsW/RodA/SpoVE family cell cycle protein [Clostridium sp.]|nr:FtsW/RodA/SpoVE family cell cycle protein [Clostridium sp.]MCM1444034.1 FtsW/RodA/SpoVE family cell cycle protein [Candidatus Amulumruptor caecigallinarius]